MRNTTLDNEQIQRVNEFCFLGIYLLDKQVLGEKLTVLTNERLIIVPRKKFIKTHTFGAFCFIMVAEHGR